MRKSIVVAVAVAFLIPLAQAKDKEKDKGLLPPTFLTARTILVTIDSYAGVSPTDPNANQTARSDVETALANWGRFNPVISREMADLVIIVRKGSGKLTT